MHKEAEYYQKLDNSQVRCLLCPHECLITEGKTGVCKVRRNSAGRLDATTYGRVAAAGMDPVEKKPLYHFHPGSMILSLGQAGCNLHCDFCQNYHMLSPDIHLHELSPQEAVRLAVEKRSLGIAYTYNEPWMGYEYVFDTAALAHEAGLKNVMVTNGYWRREPLDRLAPLIDAMNIDIKSVRDDFYPHWTRGELGPVKEIIERSLQHGIHIELTNLLITGLNDSKQHVRGLAEYVAGLCKDIPVHLSRYHPAYKMDRPSTPARTLLEAYRIAKEFLHYVYLGNVTGLGGNDSLCPGCGSVLVRRDGFSAHPEALRNGGCESCGREVNFVM